MSLNDVFLPLIHMKLQSDRVSCLDIGLSSFFLMFKGIKVDYTVHDLVQLLL